MGIRKRRLRFSERLYEYEYCERENELQSPGSDSDDADDANVKLDTLRINMGPGVCHGLYRVSAPHLQVPDVLYTIYLRLFMHMMDWNQGFHKKHSRLQAFDNAWKTLLPYPRIMLSKKAYLEVTQWRGKEMRNLGCCYGGSDSKHKRIY